jgi:ubiquinone/menaquinone biosynthesis C-methylase UbiE
MSEASEREQNARVRERFTRSAEAFVRLAVPNRGGDVETVIRLAEPRPSDVALDLACGPGTFTIALARRVKQVFGLDITPALLELARRAAQKQRTPNVTLVCGDAMALPWPDGFIDVAVSGFSFHHMADPFLALRELARVVRRGGRLAVVDLIVPEGADPEANDRIERARDPSHTHALPPGDFRRMIEDAGFRTRSAESTERMRHFVDWMRVAGWEPEDPASRETRRLMEADIGGDASGFHPRFIPGAAGAEPDIEFTQSCMFIAASKA